MVMYRKTDPVGDGGARELDQGDILSSVLLPKLPHDRAFGFQRQGSPPKWFWKASFTGQELRDQEGKELRVMSKLEREPLVLVLSNSCDNSSGAEPIILAPIRPFMNYDGAAVPLRKALADVVGAVADRCAEGGEEGCKNVALHRREDGSPICETCAQGLGAPVRDAPHADVIKAALGLVASDEKQRELRDADQWMAISRSATGANPKRIYMAGNDDPPIPRSEAHLVLAQPVDPTYATKCLKELGATRVCGLVGEAVKHLQYTVSSFYSRNPRDDHAWPSREDFMLKAVWLEGELARVNLSGEERADYVKELEFVRGVLASA